MQDILGAHAVERQGAVKAFLSLKVEGLQRVGEEEVDDVAAAAVRHVIAAGTEIDVRSPCRRESRAHSRLPSFGCMQCDLCVLRSARGEPHARRTHAARARCSCCSSGRRASTLWRRAPSPSRPSTTPMPPVRACPMRTTHCTARSALNQTPRRVRVLEQLFSEPRRAGQHEAQGMMRDACMPTMGDAGVLAGIAISEGGHAEGTLGQAGKLRALVRRLTPKRALGAASEGAVFGGGRAFLGDGAHQESLKVVARTELRVLALPAEAALLLDQGTLVQELRNHLAFQLTYWFSRTNMIDKQVRGAPLGRARGTRCGRGAHGGACADGGGAQAVGHVRASGERCAAV